MRVVAVFFAEGFEEIEAISIVDVLRRADINVLTVGIGGKTVIGTHDIPIICDITDENLDYKKLDMIVLPGGMPGTNNLLKSGVLSEIIDFCAENNRYIAAICAAPLILGRKELLMNKSVTCYPGFENELKGSVLSDNYVCRDEKIITAKGPGVAIDFALELVSVLLSAEKSEMVRRELQCKN